jgi:hypothetical protein
LAGNENKHEMNQWENEIGIKNMERTLSIVFQLQNVNDFEKSIQNDSSFSEERIEKSGQEIKEKLQLELSEITNNKNVLIAKMSKLMGLIGHMPKLSMDRQLIKGFENSIAEMPRQYGHDQVYNDQIAKATEMRDFNQDAISYVRDCVKEVKLKTIIGILPDDKKVKLSKALASELGF